MIPLTNLSSHLWIKSFAVSKSKSENIPHIYIACRKLYFLFVDSLLSTITQPPRNEKGYDFLSQSEEKPFFCDLSTTLSIQGAAEFVEPCKKSK